MESLKTQVGGNHYSLMKIQPLEYIMENNLDFNQGCIVKYISRYRNKNKDEDIRKIIQICKVILEHEYHYSPKEIENI